MGWFLSLVMLIMCMFQFDGYFLIASGLFGIAGAIESISSKIIGMIVTDKDIDEKG